MLCAGSSERNSRARVGTKNREPQEQVLATLDPAYVQPVKGVYMHEDFPAGTSGLRCGDNAFSQALIRAAAAPRPVLLSPASIGF